MLETKSLIYDAFYIVLGNPDILVLIAAFTLIVTILITIVDLIKG